MPARQGVAVGDRLLDYQRFRRRYRHRVWRHLSDASFTELFAGAISQRSPAADRSDLCVAGRSVLMLLRGCLFAIHRHAA